MLAYLTDTIPARINLDKEEMLFGPFYNIEDIYSFLTHLDKKNIQVENNIAEKETGDSYWLLLKNINESLT